MNGFEMGLNHFPLKPSAIATRLKCHVLIVCVIVRMRMISLMRVDDLTAIATERKQKQTRKFSSGVPLGQPE